MQRDAPRGPNAKQSPPQRAWGRLAVALTIGVWACSDLGGGGDETGAELSVELDLLASVADNVYAPAYADFAALADTLAAATESHSLALANGADTAASLVAAQVAWGNAWAGWQRLELMPLGPAGSSASYSGGEDLRDEIYSWPSTNPCRVDQELVLGEFDDADFGATRLVNAYGLDALEYLLHPGSDINACAPQLPINAEGQWDALGSVEVETRRAAYAAAIAQQLADEAQQLAQQWGEGGDARENLRDPERTGSPYASADAALDELTRALFYIDLKLKDAKIGAPGGVVICTSPICLDELESQFAGASKAAALENLEGFRRIFYGGAGPDEGFGFDDALASVGREDLATQMASAIDDALLAVAAVGGDDGNFRDALLADEAALDAAYASLKVITDLLKGEFTMALALQIPSEAGGDAD